jgi:hypothetical protein
MPVSEEPWKDLASNLKPVEMIDRHTFEELSKWVRDALDSTYTESRKEAFMKLVGRPWEKIESDIVIAVDSRDYARIHERNEVLLLDLLDPDVVKRIGKVIDGTLGLLRGDSTDMLAKLLTANRYMKDAKVETYILYRLLGGRPRIRYSIFYKV